MWSRTKSLLTLLEWAEIIEISPFLLAQIGEPAAQLSRSVGQCQFPFWQDGSQSADMLGREEVAQALQDAEWLVAKVLNTFPAPMERSDTLQYPRPFDLTYGQLWYGPSGRLKSVRTEYGGIISVGAYADELIEADVAVTTNNPYSDEFDTTWEVQVTVAAGTTADEIAVFFSEPDRFDFSLEAMEICPVTVTISGNTATIRGHITQLVTINHYLKLVPESLNATEPSIYAETVDVYRRTVDLGQAGTIVFDNPYWLPCYDADNGGGACVVSLNSACFKSTDARQGWVAPVPAAWDSTAESYSFEYPQAQLFAPSRVLVNYICGYPRTNGRMYRPLAQAVAYLATALLPSRTCGCDRADQRLYFYREFPSGDDPKNSGQLQVSPATIEAANSWFGVSGRGAIRAAAILMNPELKIWRTAHA